MFFLDYKTLSNCSSLLCSKFKKKQPQPEYTTMEKCCFMLGKCFVFWGVNKNKHFPNKSPIMWFWTRYGIFFQTTMTCLWFTPFEGNKVFGSSSKTYPLYIYIFLNKTKKLSPQALKGVLLSIVFPTRVGAQWSCLDRRQAPGLFAWTLSWVNMHTTHSWHLSFNRNTNPQIV